MSLIINHNLMAMNAARNLNSTYGALSTSTRRLSSGLRVGTAADDAAGLAIREMMRADIASTNQGVRNANDAISMIQVADGALSVIDEKLIRMKELATQAATGTYTSDQRLIINEEFKAMRDEINRIANSTDFNGIKMLSDELSVNWNSSLINTPGFSLGEPLSGVIATEDTLYAYTQNTFFRYDGDSSWSSLHTFAGQINAAKPVEFNNDVYIPEGNGANGFSIYQYDGNVFSEVSTGGVGDQDNTFGRLFSYSGQMFLSTINANGSQAFMYAGDGTDFSSSNWTRINTDGFGDSQNTDAEILMMDGDVYAFTTNSAGGRFYRYNGGTEWVYDASTPFSANDTRLTASVHNDKIYVKSQNVVDGASVYMRDENGVWSTLNTPGFGDVNNTYAKSDLSVGEKLIVSVDNAVTGARIYMQNDSGGWDEVVSGGVDDSDNVRLNLAMTDGVIYGSTWNVVDGTKVYRLGDVVDNGSVTVHFGNGNNSSEDYYEINNVSATSRGLGLLNMNVKTQDNAQRASDRINSSVITLGAFRASFGAMQNRLSNTIQNLQIQAENLQSSESQISDTDVAQEVTEFTKEQILTQSATAMLAQANSLPKMALQLIQGG